MKKCVISFVLLMLLSSPASAGESVLGEGTEVCSTWTASNQAGSASSSSVVMRAWVRGFVTAFTVKGSTDTRDLIDWVGSFCKANPTASLYSAVHEYVTLKVHDPDHPLYL